MHKEFNKWNIHKIYLNNKGKRPEFSERDVWFCQLGINIGFEQDGKGDKQLRPIVIIKKFNKKILLAIPLTHTLKNNQYYHHFGFKGSDSAAILSQVRLLDAKRLLYRSGKVSPSDFKNIKQKIRQLLA